MFKMFSSRPSEKNRKISLELRLTRDSVASEDDVGAPHEKVLKIKIEPTWLALFSAITEQDYLPRIDGGEATWVGVSTEPIVVIAQQWQQPIRSLGDEHADLIHFRKQKGRLRIHFSYLEQLDPEISFQVLKRCEFSAMTMG